MGRTATKVVFLPPSSLCMAKQATVLADLLEAMSEGSSSSGEELGEDSEGSADEPAVVKDQQ